MITFIDKLSVKRVAAEVYYPVDDVLRWIEKMPALNREAFREEARKALEEDDPKAKGHIERALKRMASANYQSGRDYSLLDVVTMLYA